MTDKYHEWSVASRYLDQGEDIHWLAAPWGHNLTRTSPTTQPRARQPRLVEYDLLPRALGIWARVYAFGDMTLDPEYRSGNLTACEKECLAGPGYVSTSLLYQLDCTGGPLDDQCYCGNLTESLNYVQSCTSTSCNRNASQVYQAESFLARFCTSAAQSNGYTSILSATTIHLDQAYRILTVSAAVATGSASGPTLTSAVTSAAAASVPTATGTGGSAIVTGASPGAAPLSTTGITGASAATSTAVAGSKKAGLMKSEKVGIGIGIGLGVPLILGGIAAFLVFSKRRKSRGAGGPYDAVLMNEKRGNESYGRAIMEPQELRAMRSAAPFLPAAAAGDVSVSEVPYQPPVSASAKQPQYSDVRVSTAEDDESLRYEHSHSPQEPRGPRDTPASATMPRSAVSNQLSVATGHFDDRDDAPHSPISPVSPISPTGSRPASLRQEGAHHDL
ncbi:hypothetical protein BAUCODRAFT_568952 [Baudoinia panamericana UAMH 10762]|uniref:Extracellular membrane protein CFEM domain-containing protein n=1 Tax=Baudoinia panamericana (strain UAMH 10762) TaxID=717646 RepID=M2M8Q0_BAUPA|nr:uncharacterized protein BAUCODRAFT_568952 [Baudoinia panamericana UAMH 10762]EMC92781.1 hypothetical protein BAUCODRAFT_568952 [Baudoinia panamericana UAMH 10762]